MVNLPDELTIYQVKAGSKLEQAISVLTLHPEAAKLSNRKLEAKYGIGSYVLWGQAKKVLNGQASGL